MNRRLKSNAHRCRPLLAVVALAAPTAAAETASMVNAEVGNVQYTKSDGVTPIKGTAQVMGVEYCRFYQLDRCIFAGYRQAVDAPSQRNYYLAAYAGLRFYPRHIGFPVDTAILDDRIHYDALFKPYLDGSVALGRALYSFLSSAELSADIIGLNLGAGLTWHPVSRWVVDTGVKYEQYQQNGGNSSALALTGSNLYLLLGTGFLF